MTIADAEKLYGPIVYQDDTRVVRIQNNNHFSVYVHKKKDGAECLPLAYMTGHNILTEKNKG